MSRAILKWSAPVDDQVHEIGGGPVVMVGCQDSPSQVLVWTDEHGYSAPRRVRVVGTGHPIPDDAKVLGSAQVGPLVWHVIEVAP